MRENNTLLDIFLFQILLEDLAPYQQHLEYIQQVYKQNVDLKRGLQNTFPELLQADKTSSTIFESKTITAKLISKENGLFSGLQLIQPLVQIVDPQLQVEQFKQNGDKIKPGEMVLEITGNHLSVLLLERTMLNFLTHLSGITTTTGQFVEAVKTTKAKILDTRKTIPGLRDLQKQAVIHGGGVNHRMGLFDAIMIKDNHIDICGSIGKAVNLIKSKFADQLPILVETRNLTEVAEAVTAKPTRIMLDNMDTKTMQKAVELIAGQIPTEATGNINLENILEIAKTGVDYISIGGSQTMSSQRLDLSLII